MTPINASSAIPGPTPFGAAPPKSEREQLAAAAKQFEAIFVRQMLAAARKNNLDEGGLFDSEGMNTFRQMQDDKFADTAAQTGALGLASIIEAQLSQHLPKDQ